jgi:hypothetical protein
MAYSTCFIDTCFHADGVINLPLFGTDPIRKYDLVVIDWRQSFSGWLTQDSKTGRVIIPADRARKYWDSMRARNEDMEALAEKGATIVCILGPVASYTDNNNAKVTSLDWLPFRLFKPGEIVTANDCVITPVKGSPFEAFAGAFKDHFSCCARFTQPPGFPWILTQQEFGAAGTLARFGNGYIVFIPCFDEKTEKSLSVSVYTEEQNRFMAKFLEEIMKAVEKTKRTGLEITPSWVKDIDLPADAEITGAIEAKERQIKDMQGEVERLRAKLGDSQSWRQLLYEKDENLTEAVSKSLELLGFKTAETRAKDLSVDGLFTAPEGALLIKSQGTDNSPIGKDELLDLFRQAAEEIEARDEEVSALLIGNAFRLQPPPERQSQFAETVRKIAKKHNLGLITSQALFEAVGRVLSNPEDEGFKADFRRRLIQNPVEDSRSAGI